MMWIHNMGRRLCVLGLFFVPLVVAKTCPYTHPNCECEGITVTCSNLQTIPFLNTGDDVIAVDTLQFEQGQITNVPQNSLPPGLVDITFRENPLTNISDNAFTNSSTTLKSLSIRHALFNRLPDAFAKITSLESLTLDTIDIKDWNRPVLQNIIGTLQSVYLIVIDLSVWPQWISECHSLNSLYIIAATMSTIPNDAFVSMNNTLTSFTVRSTDLTQVPKALSVLRNLTTLEITGNRLANVSGREGFEQVTTFPWSKTLLTLKGKNLFLKSLPNLSSMSSLTLLDLHFNEIPHVTSDMLPKGLVRVNLSNNSITEITESSFTNLSRLEYLYLGGNPISVISNTAFRDLVSLKTLYLWSTKLTQIPLALVLLSGLGSVDMTYINALQCPCPIVVTELQVWYASYNNTLTFTGVCSNQENITSYLNGTCQQHPPTTPCPTCGTAFLSHILARKYNCLLLLLLHFIVSEHLNRLSY